MEQLWSQFLSIAIPVLAILIPITLVGLFASLIALFFVKNYQLVGKAFLNIGSLIAKIINDRYKDIMSFLREKIFVVSTYFRLGIVACMIVSVLHGSHFFTTSLTNVFFGIDTNILLSSVIDIGIYFMLEAMVYTRKRGYFWYSLFILVGVSLWCGLSFIANYAFNQHYYSSVAFNGVGLSKEVVTLLQSTPPLIIIFLGCVGEIFIKPDKQEDLDFKGALKRKYMRRVDKLEAKLEAKKQEREIKAKFSIKEEKPNNQENKELETKQPILIQPIKWSFLGFKVYERPIEYQNAKQFEQTIQKLSVSMLHLERKLQEVETGSQLFIDAPNVSEKNTTSYKIEEVEDTSKTKALKKDIDTEKLNSIKTDDKINAVKIDDKLTIAVEAIKKNSLISDEELAELLSLKRGASARFWRLKADEILNNVDVNSSRNIAPPVKEEPVAPVKEEPVAPVKKEPIIANSFFSQFSK